MNKNKHTKEEQAWEKYQQDLDRRELYNYSAYDKAILTLSSALFAFSLTIVKDFSSQYPYGILIIWISFALAIIGSLVSFYVANKAIDYCRKIDRTKSEQWRKYAKQTNIVTGILFIIGIIAITVLAIFNLNF